jgi:hypothetical protein
MCYIHSIKFIKLRKVKSKINICLYKQKNNFYYLTENKNFTKVKERTKKVYFALYSEMQFNRNSLIYNQISNYIV